MLFQQNLGTVSKNAITMFFFQLMLNIFSVVNNATREPFSKKCDILGTKNEKKIENYGFQFFFTVPSDIQISKSSTLRHKISRLGGGGLLQRLSVEISSNIRYTITQSHC